MMVSSDIGGLRRLGLLGGRASALRSRAQHGPIHVGAQVFAGDGLAALPGFAFDDRAVFGGDHSPFHLVLEDGPTRDLKQSRKLSGGANYAGCPVYRMFDGFAHEP